MRQEEVERFEEVGVGIGGFAIAVEICGKRERADTVDC
jgi:hypothetical protein